MNDLFASPTGAPATNLTSGSPEYQAAIMQGTQAGMKPAYISALNKMRQTFASRGLSDSGIAGAGEMGMAQDYAGQLGQAANRAAIQGADLAEQNRQRLENRSWQVQDRDTQLAYLKDQADKAEQAAANKQWMDLISGAAMAGGTAMAGPMGGMMVGALTKRAGNFQDQSDFDSLNAKAMSTKPY